jgi:putative tricarboxylic transport membrane protein
VTIRIRTLIPIVLSLAVIGAYVLAQSMAGPITLFVCAVLGWLMQRFDYPVAATVVGLLLGRMTEGALLRTWQMSGGELSFILQRPIAMGFLALLVLSLVLPALRRARKGI